MYNKHIHHTCKLQYLKDLVKGESNNETDLEKSNFSLDMIGIKKESILSAERDGWRSLCALVK